MRSRAGRCAVRRRDPGHCSDDSEQALVLEIVRTLGTEQQGIADMTHTYSGSMDDSRSWCVGEDESWADALSSGQTCLFCGSDDWQWFRYLGSASADAAATLPTFAVTCSCCEELLAVRDLASVIARVEAVNPGEGSHLLQLFEEHIETPKRQRPSVRRV